jgi:hypothetical protein
MYSLPQLHPGDKVRFGAGRSLYVVEWLEQSAGDHLFVIAHGPLGSLRAKSGKAFYVGPGAMSRVNPITGERETLEPVKVRLVNEEPCKPVPRRSN